MAYKSREDHLAYNRRYYQDHKRRHQELAHRWYTRNKKKARASNQKWKKKNWDRVLESSRQYFSRHKDEVHKRHRDYQRSHQEEGTIRTHNYRARKRSAPGSHTAQDIFNLWEKQHHKCAVPKCPYPISGGGKNHYHTDHIWPLNSPEGTNWPDNLQLLCTFHNCSKDDKDPNEWGKQYGLKYKRPKHQSPPRRQRAG